MTVLKYNAPVRFDDRRISPTVRDQINKKRSENGYHCRICGNFYRYAPMFFEIKTEYGVFKAEPVCGDHTRRG